jgi:type VI protein secretion system component Hcp
VRNHMGGKTRAACALAVVLGALLTAGSSSALAARPPTPSPTPIATPTPRPPTPTPRSTATPTPTPTPVFTPPPPPTLTPVPPPCNTRVPQATGAGGFLQVAGVAGDATEAPHAGAIVLTGASPASMLPPVVGTVPLTEITLVKPVDRSSQALVRAVASALHFDCARVELGLAHDYLYATFAFHDAQFATYAPTGAAQSAELLTLTYARVEWEYQLRDGSPVATGSGALGSTPNPRGPGTATMSQGPPALALVLLVVVCASGAGAVLWLRRRRRRRNLLAGSRHL